MRIEAVCVCVDYADFLEQTLPTILPHVDDLIIVTTPEDGRTKRLCAQHGVRCLPTRCFSREDHPGQGGKPLFNKARGINYGLAHLRTDGWILHLDADVVLPHRTRYFLQSIDLDPRKIYGIDRVNCVGRAAWDQIKLQGEPQYEWSCLVKPPANLPLGARIAHMDHGGYVPIGFFQLWNGQSGITRYPIRQGSAEHTDVLHALQWDKPHRQLLPELIAIHLETRGKPGPMGANWSGRTTPEFTIAEGPYRVSAASLSGSPASYGTSKP
jgi:hypothetical protein